MQKSSSRNHTEAPPSEGSLRFRREILIHAQLLLQKIDSVEDEIARYQESDLPLFSEWFAATFKEERQVITALEKELAAQVQFHNSMVAFSKMRDVSLARAFAAIKDEQKAYVAGNEARRRKIEDERLVRELFVRQDLQNEFDQRLNFTSQPQDAGASETLPAAIPDSERMKLVYRRLVRRLHPDMQGPNMDVTESRWQKRIWHLSQIARQNGDVEQLDALYKVSLLRQMELSELTISDAHEVHAWLKNELDRLEVEFAEMKVQPSWCFSLTGENPALLHRILSDFEGERDFLETEIREIQSQHDYLEGLSFKETAVAAPAEMKRRRSRPRTSPTEDPQLSLFDSKEDPV